MKVLDHSTVKSNIYDNIAVEVYEIVDKGRTVYVDATDLNLEIGTVEGGLDDITDNDVWDSLEELQEYLDNVV